LQNVDRVAVDSEALCFLDRDFLVAAVPAERETHDDSWLTLRFVPPDELLETLEKAEMVLPSGARFHYSNLAFALLGIVVERVSGMPYMDYIRERLFEPVGLTRMSFEAEPPAATGYIGQPYADGVWNAIHVETGAWASAGQLWGTVGDLCRWGAFLVDPDEAVLAKKSAEEMRTVQVMVEHDRWLVGYGLGVMLRRDGERILAGHTGSMIGLKAATMAGTIFFSERMWKTNKVGAIVMMAAINGATAAVSMHNMQNAKNAGRAR